MLIKELFSVSEGKVIYANFPTAEKKFIVAKKNGTDMVFWSGTDFEVPREKAAKLSKQEAEKLYSKFAGPDFRLKIVPN